MGHTAGMHTRDRAAAIKYGEQMPAARVVINSPTTHGAIGLTTDLAPSMTLGCGSWGGNVTSDNISPIHLMDIKRVAFETKPINAGRSVLQRPVVATNNVTQTVPEPRKAPRREEIAAIVDSFLSKKLAEEPKIEAPQPPVQLAASPAPNGGPKTIVHEITPENAVQKPVPIKTADFVSEDDVRKAIAAGDKIYISKKTILTPSARDLGEEKEVFATI